MPTAVKIVVRKTILRGELFDSPCAQTIVSCLPLEVRPHEWGDEFYFVIPVDLSLDESATRKVNMGDIGYWLPGKALAIFFGPTPMSTGLEPVPASEINVVGRILNDATALRMEKGAKKIRIELI